jgi:hypothetical protein
MTLIILQITLIQLFCKNFFQVQNVIFVIKKIHHDR